MIGIIINNSFRLFILVLIQVLVLNNIQFSGLVNPYLYVLFILLLPFETPGWLLLMSSFLIGMLVDIFPQGIDSNSNTIGLHASATVFAGFFRPLILKFISPKDGYEIGTKPSIKYYGLRWFIRYSTIIVILHHVVLFFLEDPNLSNLLSTLSSILFSFVFTMILIIISQYIFYKRK